MRRFEFHNLLEMIRPFAEEWSTKVWNDVISLEKKGAITLH